MGKQNRTTLKNYYSTGKVPTQGNYADLIDSFMNLEDEDPQIIKGGISSSKLVLGSHITASGNISASGYVTASQLFGSISSSYIVTPFPQDLWTDANITASGNLRIGGSASLSEITASGGISAASITATSASFSYIQGNSPITIEDPVNFTSGAVTFTHGITASGDIEVAGTIFGTISTGTGAQTGITSLGTQTKLNVTGDTLITGSKIELVPTGSDAIVKITGSLGVSATVDATDYLIEGKNAIDYSSANGRIVLGQNSLDLLLRGDNINIGADNTQDTHISANAYITGSIILGGTTISATAAEINKLDGLNTTKTELNYLSGITSANATYVKAMNQHVHGTSVPTFEGIRITMPTTVYNVSFSSSTVNSVSVAEKGSFLLEVRSLPILRSKHRGGTGWATNSTIKMASEMFTSYSTVLVTPVGASTITALPIMCTDGSCNLAFENSSPDDYGGSDSQYYSVRIITG